MMGGQKQLFFTLIAFSLLLIFTSRSHSADFIATTLGDYGNVTIMEVTGNYDANNPDGSVNADPRKEIAKEFYRLHKDEYDFLVIYSNFDFQMSDAKAFYLSVKNDTRGIGRQIFDNSSLFGSNRKLQGTIDMGNIANLAMDPLDPNYEFTLDTISHEMMHRWAAFVKFRNPDGSLNSSLLGRHDSHWSFLLSTDASLMYGNTWQDNGNGTFTSIAARKYYSPIDLYLMGFIDKTQVPPMLLIDNPDIDPKQMPETGITITGSPTYVTIDQIIAAEGERSPGPAESQKSFKTAFIFITTPGSFIGDELYGIENIRNGWVTRYSVLSDGKGIMEVAALLREDLPVNPGTILPPVTPRTVPPNMEEGVIWLMNDQNADGSWADLAQTAERDAAETVLALKDFAVAEQNYTLGLQWLNSIASDNTDYLSRKIEVMAQAGQDITLLLQPLISRQNLDGGWGTNWEYMSSTADTAYVLKAFSSAGYADQGVIGKAVTYLKAQQNSDHGWGIDNASSIQLTAHVIRALDAYKSAYPVDENIAQAVAWLAGKQNPDGGFGNSPSTLYDTAETLLTLGAFDISKDIMNRAVQYILSLQSGDGSWNESPYQTALAIEAVWKATVDPDLSIKNADITFIPANVSSLPSNIVINAVIENTGRTGVPAAYVALYEGAIAEPNKIDGQTVAFPGQSSVNVTFNATARDGNEHRFYIIVDPEDLITEPNEANNTAIKVLYPQATYDLELLASDITLSANPVDIFKDLKITSKISNKGTMNAYNVQVRHFIDETAAPFEIATATVNIPAGATITNEVIWKTDKAGVNLRLTVLADPFDTFAEVSEENNKAVMDLTVNGSTEPNLTVSYRDMVISPSPANERGNATISALVKNEGFSAANSITVSFYKGVPGVDGVLLGTLEIPSLAAGESSRVSFDWTDIMDAGERVIYVKVDPSGQITEISKDDNDAFVMLDILSLPDLAISANSVAFSPSAPKEGDTVEIAVTIKNLGRQRAAAVSVKVVDGDAVIGTNTISVIAGNAQETVLFSYDTTGKSGAHKVTVVVDPDRVIAEQSDDNNSATKTFGVQNANLWLTETIFSPNGDGIKDNTQFFFSLDSRQTVKVTIVNKRGEIVRTFSGSELTDILAGNITWDGLNDIGVVVADGQYQIKVVDFNSNVLSSLLVILDNNRSPLTDAIGTKYLLNTNLTCNLPSSLNENWQWLPDESGIIFSIPNPNQIFPEYPNGVYLMGPDGSGISRIVPDDWTYDNPTYQYSNFSHVLSPAGDKLAVIFSRYDRINFIYTFSELWIGDVDRKNFTFIADRVGSVNWSPDGKYVAYTNSDGLWIFNLTQFTKVKVNSERYLYDLHWSSAGTNVVYVAGFYDQDRTFIEELMISDTSGNTGSLYRFENWNSQIEWLGNDKILVMELSKQGNGYGLRLVDPGGGLHVELSDALYEFSIAPSGRTVAFIESLPQKKIAVRRSDAAGNIITLYETLSSDIHGLTDVFPPTSVSSLTWSHDSGTLAFVDVAFNISHPKQDCPPHYEPHAVVIDASTQKESSFKLMEPACYDYECFYNTNSTCFPDGNEEYFTKLSFFLEDNDHLLLKSTRGYSFVSLESGENEGYLPMQTWRETDVALSGLARTITYYASDESGICRSEGYGDNPDLWALRSLLNLTADLTAVKNRSYVILKGTAADLNFEGYMLEYSDTRDPAAWSLVKPPSDVSVVNSVFTTWVPPYEGVFYVRLTVWDKAGNTIRRQKSVSWGLSSSLTNLYKSTEIFSPNNDGLKDTISLNYSVLEPLHLEFYIYDETNTIIRTFLRNYTAPGADNITWDGRDAYGNLVPDGKYAIKVFDYEFFVEVDNTPPDLNLGISSISQLIDQKNGVGPLIASMDGHAYDQNMKHWSIEYGEGSNPDNWYQYSSGAASFAATDKYGNIIFDSIQDIVIKSFLNQSITELTGKRFRITAEDSAGNRSTFITNMLEERLLLYFHDYGSYPDDHHEYFQAYADAEYASLELPEEHILRGVDTITPPLSEISLQYWDGRSWQSTTANIQQSDGDIHIRWDKRSISGEIGGLRIRAFDDTGQEYTSNMVRTRSLFYIDKCADLLSAAKNYLFEQPSSLRLQIMSEQDARYAQWTDYLVMNAPYIPTGSFSLAPFPELRPNTDYHFRMVGIAESGHEYIGDENVPSCPQDAVQIKLDLNLNDFATAECGQLSNGRTGLTAALSAKDLRAPITVKVLSYYLHTPEGPQLLRRIDLANEVWSGVPLDTSHLPEGSYSVSAVLDYFDTSDYRDKQLSGGDILIVDRTLPEAKITYPSNSQILCPVKHTDAVGDWFALPIEGIALDNIAAKRYELYYGFGEAPETWKPALKRIIGKNGAGFVPITGTSVEGKLDDWYVEGIRGTVSLKLKVIDIAGNVTCFTTSFAVKDVIDFVDPVVDKALFSPNRDGLFDDVNVRYEINEYATVDLKVYPLILTGYDLALGQSAIGTIASGLIHPGGEGYASWDGSSDAGTAADGFYGIAVLATDACGNTRTRWTEAEVDNTLPVTLISYPVPGDIIGNIIEVKGTVSDDNFRNYQLEAAPAGSTNEWRLIANNANPIKNDILGKWNTYGLNGTWTVRLIGYDAAGNKNETYVDIDLGEHKDLIKDLDISPKHFSPNNDGIRDVATLKYELTYGSDVKIDVLDSAGTMRKTYSTATASFGSYTYAWDGTDAAGITVPDNTYFVKLTAALTADLSVNQSETITVVADTKAPLIEMRQPVSGSYIRTDVTIDGSISDLNIKEYVLTVLSDTGTEVLDQGNQNRIAYHFGLLTNPAEGNYTLNVKAKDLGENSAEENILFVIDRTPPKVTLETPKSGEYFGNNKTEISVIGSIEEKNLQTFELRYGMGDTPAAWTELLRGTTLPTVLQIHSWQVGRNDNIPDGNYTLSLFAKDRAGLTGESRIKLTIDNTAPETAITLPLDGSYVKTSLDIKGTAFDLNLDKYTVELSEGTCQSAFKWSTLMSSTKSVKDSVLAKLQVIPADGEYCIKVSAIDKLDNRTEARARITIDTQPPVAPLLAGKVENRTDVRLTWSANTEPDIAGYDLYRDGRKMNTTLLAGLFFLDAGLTEGTYTYTLKAVDHAGNESLSSNELKLKIDLTGPDARLRSPQDSARVGGLLDIKGTAYSQDDFKEYRLYIGKGLVPDSWSLIRKSPVPEPYGLLAQWDSLGIPENTIYSIRLDAEDLSGNISRSGITVVIDNMPPVPPVLISALPNLSDVAPTWQANNEQDLSGYLLYRNDQLANAQGIVIGNLKPYLIAGTTYPDKGLPDGEYRYYLIAMDQAGNLSDQSNSVEVMIDTRPPHAAVVEPADLSKFDRQILLKAESPDIDISGMQFQYRKASEQVWADLGSPISRQPYITFLDPIAVGLNVGEYHVRAVATDKGGKTDPTPEYVTLTYTDVTAPDLPKELKALTDGASVTLTWISNPAGDLAGYNIYRTSGGAKARINAVVVKDPTYLDANLGDGSYEYEITSIDTSGNESKPSNVVSAKVYAPLLVQPYTPTDRMGMSVNGRNAAANAVVQIFAEVVSGPELRGTTNADAAGNFALDFSLSLGENRITSISTDAAGNISRVSDMVVVVYNETPLPPKGLQSAVNGHDINLTWGPNNELDLVGYNIFRGDEKLNPPVPIASGNATSSSYYYYYGPSNVFDGDPNSYWLDLSYGTFTPVWLQIDLPSPELITNMEINWLGDVYAGSDYEVQAWSGYAWITLKKVAGNTAIVNSFDFKPSYRTDKIRISITGSANQDYYKQVGISEILVLRDNLLTEASYSDLNLSDGKYAYSITAVDYYGFESLHSGETKAEVGDIIPPAAPINLTAVSTGQNISLSWSANTESDLAGYSLYRFTLQGWTRLNTSLISGTTFADEGLSNGIYAYRVIAVDAAGNESLPSSEATATVYVPDTTLPSKPVLFFPTVAGLPIVLQKDRTEIMGFAEPGSSVTLYKSGVPVSTITALVNDDISTLTIDYVWGDATPSPDGKSLAYMDSNYSLWVRDLVSGTAKQVAQYGNSPVWSADGSKLAFQYNEDRNGQQNYLIGIYDTRVEAVTPLSGATDDPYIDEYSPIFSSDGSKVAFVSYQGGSYNIWFKDLIGGEVKQLTYAGYPELLTLSPDGKKIAYIDGEDYFLYVMDIASGEIILIDDSVIADSLDWSPDSSTLLFSSSVNGNVDLYHYYLPLNVRTQLTTNAEYEFAAQWSPDGKNIFFGQYDVNWNMSLRIIPADAPHEGRILSTQPDLYNLSWLRSGAISFTDGSVLMFAHPKGYFRYMDVPLDAGDNLFSAIATDSSGNTSQPSDEISVTFETSQLPDIETLTEDIYLYPSVPIEGQPLSMNIVVWNRGQTEATDVAADVYILDAAGNLESLKSVSIPLLSPDSGEIIGISWDTSGKKGANRLFVILDPSHMIPEQREDNNRGEKEFVVVTGEGVSLASALSAEQLRRGQDENIDITMVNSGIDRETILEVTIEDENGHSVAVLDPITIQLAYGSKEHFAYSWNAGSVYAGLYRVRIAVRDASGILAENILPFAVLPEIAIEATVVTDKALYGPRENVQATFTLKNNGLNYIIPELKIKGLIMDAAGTVLFSEERDVRNMLPGALVSYNAMWDTGLTAPGNYHAAINIYYDGRVILSKAASFSIESVVTVSGTLHVAPSVVMLGNAVHMDYAVLNVGNADAIGLLVRVLVEDPETQAVLKTFENIVDLGINSSALGQFILSTQGLDLKAYTAALYYEYQGDSKTLSRSPFSVKDGVPPAVQITSPLTGAIFNSMIDITAIATDDVSGVDRVEFRIDNGPWRLLPITDPASGRYATTWQPVQADEGTRTIDVRATDRSGNTSPISSTLLIIDTTVPVLIVSTLSAGSWTNNEVLNITGNASDNMGVRQVIVNDAVVTLGLDGTFSYAAIMQDGQNTISIIVTDFAGNETTDVRTIYLDRSAPAITIIAPVDNMKTRLMPLDLSGTVDEQSSVAVTINGSSPVPAVMDANSFSLPVMLNYGINTIEATATDLAGNISSTKRTILFDDRSPSLAVTDPAKDIKTNRAVMTLSGEVQDLTGITVTVTLDGITYLPERAGATFTLPITFSAERAYQIFVKAVDELGNESVVQRNVLYDITAPALTVDMLTSPTNMVSQTVAGSVEPGGIVSVACPTANVGLITYPTPDTWAVLLSNMEEGIHLIEINASDDLGNMSRTITKEVVVDLTSPFVTVAAPATGSHHSGKVEIVAIVTDAGSGVENVEYQIDSGDWLPLPVADPAVHIYSSVWLPVLSDEGTHTINFRAADRLGFLSNPVSVTFEVKSALNSGIEIEKTIPDVRNTLVWLNDGCRENHEESSRRKSGTEKSYPSGYSDSNKEGDRCHEDETEKQRLTSNPDEEDSEDNEDSSAGEHECRKCIRRDLVVQILGEWATSYLIVNSVKDFQHELRNPYYTDVLILGDQHTMEDHYWEELREKINSGVGLVTSLWMSYGADDRNEADDPLLGIRYKGKLSGRTHEIRTIKSPITGEGLFDSRGVAERIVVKQGTEIVGWLKTGDCGEGRRSPDYRKNESDEGRHEKSCESPAIVLSKYGKGRVVFHAFDIGETLNEKTYTQMATLIRNALSYTHSVSDGNTFGPGSLIPVAVSLRSLGNPYDLKVAELYPATMKIYDPASGTWITENPWTYRLHIEPSEAALILYYALVPDRGGIHTLKTDISYLENGTFLPYKSVSRDIVVANDLRTLLSDVLRVLNELDSKKNSPEVRAARRIIQQMLLREANTEQAIEEHIRSVVSAINRILMANLDIARVRGMMDELLKGLESRYYYLGN